MGTGELTQSSFAGAGGREIAWRGWEAASGAVRAVVLVAHGFGEHSGRYDHVAGRLAAEGYAVYALDHHGHGRSQGIRARISFPDAVADLDQLAALASQEHPGLPLFLLGHSMGGAIALRYTLAHGERLAGLIVSGPLVQVEGRAAAKLLGRLLGRVAPNLPVARIDPELVSRDPAVVSAYREDPLVHHGPVPAGTAAQFIAHAETLPRDVPALEVATLLLYGTGDRLCDPAGATMLAQAIGSRDLTTIPYEDLYHEIFNEPERDRVLGDVCAWLDARTPALSR